MLSADADFTAQNSEIAPSSSFWKISESSRRYDETRTTSIVLKRSEGGFLDIKQGKTIKASILQGEDTILDSKDLTWKVAGESDSDDDSDDDNDDNSGDDDANDDGASAVTTFGAAVIAAVASLLF